MKKRLKFSYLLIALLASSYLLKSEGPDVDVPEVEKNIKEEEQKEQADEAAEEKITEEEQAKLEAIKNESPAAQAADANAITADTNAQLAPYRSDSAIETASIETEKKEIESAEGVSGDVAANVAAEKAFVTATDQAAVNQTLSNIEANLTLFGKELEAGSFLSTELFSVIDTFNQFRDALAAVDTSSSSDLTTDQITKVGQLKIQVDAMRDIVHANVLHTIDQVIDASNALLFSDAVTNIRAVIRLVYGLDISLGDNVTAAEKAFNQEGISLFNELNGITNLADYEQKLLALKQNMYDISIDLLDGCLNSEEQLAINPLEGSYLPSLNEGLNTGIHVLDDLMNKYQPELGAQNGGALVIKVSTILYQVKDVLTGGTYENLTVSQLSDTGKNVDYALYALREAVKTATDQNDIAQINDDISDLMIAKLKIDAALPIAQVAKGVNSFSAEFNKDSAGQVTAVKSLAQRFFGRIIDAVSSLFENIQGLIIDKTIGIFKDQNANLKTNLDIINTSVQKYIADSTTMVNSANAISRTSMPDFSRDRTPSAKLTDPNYRRLEGLVSEAEAQLQTLEKQTIDAYAKQQKSNVLMNEIGGKQALFTVSEELEKLPIFVRSDGTFDGQKMEDYFSNNMTQLTNDTATLTALGYAKTGVVSDGNLALGQELFDGIQNKQFSDLSYDQAFTLSAFYRIKLLRASGGAITDETTSVRDLTNLLDQGGDGVWQQVRVCMQGGIDVGTAMKDQDPTFADALAYYSNTIWVSTALINSDLSQNYGNLSIAKNALKEWIDEANQLLNGTVPTPSNGTNVPVVDPQTHSFLTTDQFSEDDPIIGQDPFIEEDTSL